MQAQLISHTAIVFLYKLSTVLIKANHVVLITELSSFHKCSWSAMPATCKSDATTTNCTQNAHTQHLNCTSESSCNSAQTSCSPFLVLMSSGTAAVAGNHSPPRPVQPDHLKESSSPSDSEELTSSATPLSLMERNFPLDGAAQGWRVVCSNCSSLTTVGWKPVC